MKKHYIILFSLLSAFMLTFSIWSCVKKTQTYSDAERRVLAAVPELSAESIINGSYSGELEEYLLDHFPLRDYFRGLKAAFSYGLLMKTDNNGIYCIDGKLSKIDYPMKTDMLDYAAKRFNTINELYLKTVSVNTKFCIIPEKNEFNSDSGILSYDYKELCDYIKNSTGFCEFIDVTSLLGSDDYYATDTHWRQECLPKIAEYIGDSMGVDVSAQYKINTVESPFFGVYSGQYALPIQPDVLKYLTNDVISGCIVTSYDSGSPEIIDMYDLSKAEGKDPYELFLSGNNALMTIENPSVTEKRELIIFRDSYGSSLAPLLVQGYSKITLIDLRYIYPEDIGYFTDFNNKDVLFLYSTLLLNNSLSLK